MNKNDHLNSKLEEINQILIKNYNDSEDIGVLTGSSGIALFHFYYSKLRQDEANANIGVEIISSIIDKINNGYSTPAFCTGVSGAAWVIELLKEEDFVDLDTDALLSDLDGFLENSLQIDTLYNYFDFLHGIIGIGYYFIKRYENTLSEKLRANYKRLVLDIIDKLHEAAQIDGHTAKWESNLIFEEKLRGYNLSLSHGISSIINFLARVYVHSDFKDAMSLLLQQSVNYVVQQYSNSPESTSCFPDWISSDNKKSESARLAWCYGDLGIAMSLWRASKVLKNQELSSLSLNVFKHSAMRRDIKEVKIVDAGLCHGSYGVMHIFSYMYKETGDLLFKDTADYWIHKALEMDTHENGYAGYCKWYGGSNPGWSKESNLLEGISGIGLALISYLAPFKTKWDECLMIG